MGRKKIDKDTIEYISKNLFYKDLFKGFQFTAGRTPLGIKNNDKYDLGISLNFNEGKSSSVIDGSEFRLIIISYKDNIEETLKTLNV